VNEHDQLSGSAGPAEHIGAPTGAATVAVASGKLRVSSTTVEGNDAVCFTAGPEAAVVGVGTIHAYLAARRQCPKVVAGISLGALNAAAMQRVYKEGQGPSVVLSIKITD